MYIFEESPNEIARLSNQGLCLRSLSSAFVGWSGLSEGARVLELGCGTGEFTHILLKAVGQRGSVTAVDRSEECLKKASKTLIRHNLRFVHMDVEKSIPNETYDVIAGRFILAYLADPMNQLDQLALGTGATHFLFQEWDLEHTPETWPACQTLKELHRAVIDTLVRAGIQPSPIASLALDLSRNSAINVRVRSDVPLGFSVDKRFLNWVFQTPRALLKRMVEAGSWSSEREGKAAISLARKELNNGLRLLSLNPIMGLAADISPSR